VRAAARRLENIRDRRARAGVEPHRIVRARSLIDAARFDDGDRRSIDRAATRSRDVGARSRGIGKNL